jgi:hypothetical protein
MCLIAQTAWREAGIDAVGSQHSGHCRRPWELLGGFRRQSAGQLAAAEIGHPRTHDGQVA